MVVITGIISAIRIGARVAPILIKIAKKTPAGVRYFDRHRKAATIVTTVASTAPLLYDLLNVDYSAILKTFPRITSRKIGQTRSNMVFSKSRRKCYPDNRPRNRY